MRWILGIWLLVNSSSAVAQGAECGDNNKILRHLEEKYNEVVKHAAITGRGALAEWTVAPSGSWSMLVTIPGGPTCLVSSGDSWQDRMKVEGIRV